jgi:hypothetical protein
MKYTFILLILGTLILSGCTHSKIKSDAATSETQPITQEDANFPIIDAHTHNHFRNKLEAISQIPDTMDEYLRELKESNVVGAVVLLDPQNTEYHDFKDHNIIACAGASAHPDYAGIESGLKSGKYSCIKIYLGYIYVYAWEEPYRKLYRLAEKYDVPVVFHTGDTYSVTGKLKYSDPLTIDEVAVDFPKVRFVIAHCGNPWIESAAEVAYKNPNVWLDGSALLINTAHESPENIDKFVVQPLRWIFGYIENPDKLMYGTDWPLTDMKSYKAAFQRAIPRQYWRKVFYENAQHVFKFPKKVND